MAKTPADTRAAILPPKLKARQLRRKLAVATEKLLPDVCGTHSVILRYSTLGPHYKDTELHMRDAYGFVMHLLCDASLRCIRTCCRSLFVNSSAITGRQRATVAVVVLLLQWG